MKNSTKVALAAGAAAVVVLGGIAIASAGTQAANGNGVKQTFTNGHSYSLTVTASGNTPLPSGGALETQLAGLLSTYAQVTNVTQPTPTSIEVDFNYTGPTQTVTVPPAPGVNLVFSDMGPTNVSITKGPHPGGTGGVIHLVANVQVAGSYTQLSGTSVLPGKSYLLSAYPGSKTVSGMTLQSAASALQSAGATILQQWNVGDVPANWPSSDVDPAEYRLSFSWPTGGLPTNLGTTVPNANLFATQGSTS